MEYLFPLFPDRDAARSVEGLIEMHRQRGNHYYSHWLITALCPHNYFPIMELSFSEAIFHLYSPFLFFFSPCFLNLHSIAMIEASSIGLFVARSYEYTRAGAFMFRAVEMLIIQGLRLHCHSSLVLPHTHTHTLTVCAVCKFIGPRITHAIQDKLFYS